MMSIGMQSPPAVNFRKDINGLRAWAVVAVVLFHFGVPGFSGGFIGVDVFFVISGFLMTTILIKKLENQQQKFSVWEFYLARAKRIAPALLVLCITLLALGWFMLPPQDYRSLGMHTLTSVFFASNIQYWREAGYFDAASHDKWLLHTWSLSVEWQFYLLLPLLLWGVWRWWPGRASAVRCLVVVFLASLGLSIWLTAQKPEAAFFLLPTRAWEMLSGGLVALLAGGGIAQGLRVRGRAVEALGLAMIALSIATANPLHWPGAAAMLPVMGTVLVLLAQRGDSVFTAPAVLQGIGNWSYSIYLWHWPVAVALAYGGWQSETGLVALGMGLSLLLGWLSFRWVEPLGHKQLAQWRTWPALAVFGAVSVLVALPALGIRLLHGVPGRLSPTVESISAAANDSNPLRDKSHSMGGMVFKKHVYGGPSIRAIVLGDSHASTIVTAVQGALANPEHGVLGMSYTSCPTLFGVRQERQDLHCAAFNEWALQQMAAVPSDVPVIIANRSSAYLYGNRYGAHELDPVIFFDSTLRKLDKGYSPFMQEYADHLVASTCRIAKTRPVYLLRPLPEMPVDVPRAMVRAAQLERPADVVTTLATYHQRHAVTWAAQDKAQTTCGAHLLNPLPYLCDGQYCQGADGGKPRYYDDNHMTETGNRRLVPLFATALGNALPSVATGSEVRH